MKSWMKGRPMAWLALLLTLSVVAAACGSGTAETAATDDVEEAVDEAAPEAEERSEADDAMEEEEEPEEEEPAEEEPAEEEEAMEEEPEPAELEPVSIPDMGTSIDIQFDIPTEFFGGVGALAMGREGELSPFDSGLLFLRPTGYASLDLRVADFANLFFTETLDTWLTHPEVNVASEEETTVGGFDARVIDFTMEPSDEAFTDCGPPGFETCIFFASTPDPTEFGITVARAGQQFRLWEVDQGDESPLLLWAVAVEGDDEWIPTVEQAIETITLGDPQPAPESLASIVEAGPVSFDSLGGIAFDLPRESLVIEGTQCVLLQYETDVFDSGIIIGRIDQNIEGEPLEDDQAYFDSFDGQISREETGRSIDLWGTTLTEYAVEETGQNMAVNSCAPIGGNPLRDVVAGFVGAGTEYVADAADGGFYLVAWTTVDPDRSEEMQALFDEIVASLEVSGG